MFEWVLGIIDFDKHAVKFVFLENRLCQSIDPSKFLKNWNELIDQLGELIDCIKLICEKNKRNKMYRK